VTLTSEGGLASDRSTIVVENTRKWFGDQRLGAFHVALDGTRAGVASPGQQLDIACIPGPHTVRIRQWWYRSKPVTVDLRAGEVLRLVASTPRGGNLLIRMAILIFRPSRSLSLDKRANVDP
jgi:hypothetical protein